MITLEDLSAIIENGDVDNVRGAVAELIDAGVSSGDIIQNAVVPGMINVGRKFETQQIFIPEMLRAARAVRLGNELLCARAGHPNIVTPKKIVLGTVYGDLHDIGKDLVALAMRLVGINVIDLGVDVPPEQFVRAVNDDENVVFVGISALLTVTLPAMKRTVEVLRSSKASDRITIFVGGAPVTEKFAKEIGADIYTDSAFAAAEKARLLLQERGEL